MLTTLLTLAVIFTGILAGYAWVTALQHWLGDDVPEAIEVPGE